MKVYALQQEASLREVGEALGLSFERVRQIEHEALRKLRVALERAGLEANDVHAWLDSKAAHPDAPSGDSSSAYTPRDGNSHDSRAYRWREERERDDARIEREAEAVVREIRATAAAHALRRARRVRDGRGRRGARARRARGEGGGVNCVICDRELPRGRRTYCSETCAVVIHGPKSTRTLRDQVARDLFLAREAYARCDAPTHEMRVRIDYLAVWLGELDRTGAGQALAHQPRPARRAEGAQLALPEVA